MGVFVEGVIDGALCSLLSGSHIGLTICLWIDNHLGAEIVVFLS